MTVRQRQTDKAPYRYRWGVHIFSGIMVGWMLKTYFPGRNAFMLVGVVWDWVFDVIQGLGGLSVVVSAFVAIFNVVKWVKDRRKNG